MCAYACLCVLMRTYAIFPACRKAYQMPLRDGCERVSYRMFLCLHTYYLSVDMT